MPFIDVKVYDSRLDERTERELIERITQAAVDVFDESIRPQTWVALTGVAPGRWGIGGIPGS